MYVGGTVHSVHCWHCLQCGDTLHSGHFGLCPQLSTVATLGCALNSPQWTLWAVPSTLHSGHFGLCPQLSTVDTLGCALNSPQWTLWAVGIFLSVVEPSTVATLSCWHCSQCGGTLHSGHFGLLALFSVWWNPPQWTLWSVGIGGGGGGGATT